MSRYIDADEVSKNSCKWLDGEILVMAVSCIDDAPTALEIVRCKDCVYSVKCKPTDTFFDCDLHCKNVDDDDFCSWGERCE